MIVSVTVNPLENECYCEEIHLNIASIDFFIHKKMHGLRSAKFGYLLYFQAE